MTTDLSLLKTLVGIPSPVGRTQEKSDFLAELFRSHGIPVHQSPRGGLLVGSPNARRALAAHIDTNGAMVVRVRDNGRPELTPLGCWSSRFAEGAEAFIPDLGVTGTIVPLKASGHTYSDEVDTQPVNWQNVELRLDIPTTSAAETMAAGVRPGTIVAVEPGYHVTDTGYVKSRFLDNNVGLFAIAKAIIKSYGSDEPAGVTDATCAVFSTVEEVGTDVSHLLPSTLQELVMVDIGPVAPIQSSREDAVTICRLDKGGPYDQALCDKIEAVATASGLPVVNDVFRHYFSDGFHARIAGCAARQALVCFGSESSHGYERTTVTGIAHLSQLLSEWLKSPLAKL